MIAPDAIDLVLTIGVAQPDATCPQCGDGWNVGRYIGAAERDQPRWCKTCALDLPLGDAANALDDLAAAHDAAEPEHRQAMITHALAVLEWLAAQ